MMPKLLPVLLLAIFFSHSVDSFHSHSRGVKRALCRKNDDSRSSSQSQSASCSIRPAFFLWAESNDDTPLNTPSSNNNSPSRPQDAPMDPLFKAVTRMDESTANAKTMQIPLWGELILDQSLFLLIPIALFAFLGIASSIIVLLSSTDEFATAIQDQAAAASSSSDSMSSTTCRGLCSDDNIDSLRQYMMGISGKNSVP